MKYSSRLLVGLAAISLSLSGCGLDQHPSYSASVKYGLRTDPLVGTAKDLGDERYEVDLPGILPIVKLEDINKPEHPYHANRAKLDDKVLRDPTKVSKEDRDKFEAELDAIFGTPGQPKVDAKAAAKDSAETAELEKVIAALKLDKDKLDTGSKRYRVHCLHCHGVSGNGRGPTARWINPHPRDFRLGIFKFQSVDQSAGTVPISRADLERTIRMGLEGTAMPSFNLLQNDEIDALISYVIHLSIRGQTEFIIMKTYFSADRATGTLKYTDPEGGTLQSNIKYYAGDLAKKWLSSQDPAKMIKPAPYRQPKDDAELAESMRRGQQLFSGKPSEEFKKAHVLRGESAVRRAVKFGTVLEEKRDAAKKKNPKLTDAELAAIQLDDKEITALAFTKTELAELEKAAADPEKLNKAELFLKGPNCVSCHTDYGRQAKYRFDDWGTLVRPNNLPLGNLRGGRRPVDIYYRIHSGIQGSGMTPFGASMRGNEDYIWDLVNFVSNLSYPAMRKNLDPKID